MKKLSWIMLAAALLFAAGCTPKPAWDGDMAPLQALYDADDTYDGKTALSKFCAVDIDGDGIDEIWARDAEDENGAVFCFGSGEPELVAVEYWRQHFLFFEGRVNKAGPAGGPAYYSEDHLLENSRPVHKITAVTLYGELDEVRFDGKGINQMQLDSLRAGFSQVRIAEEPEWTQVAQ